MASSRRWVGAVVALGVLACSSKQGDAGTDGATPLVRTEAEPPGASCPSGGVVVRAGVDADGDGTLDAAEVSSTSYLCDRAATVVATEALGPGDAHCAGGGLALHHGSDLDGDGALDPGEVAGTDYVCRRGGNGLVAVAAEGAGPSCALGGLVVRTGVDANGDGLLQPAEVAETAYVCNGADGLVPLVRQDDEPAGASCALGGRSVSSGLDLDRDGRLDLAEVTATAYVCNGATGDPGPQSLFSISDEPPGEHCADGGEKVETGPDADGDGALDPAEVRNTGWLCAGPNRVYATSAALAGGVCPRGGVRVETGIDGDGDGLLDAAEVAPEATRYVCNLAYVAVDAGDEHACALVSDGTVRCWGANTSGQLGNATTVSSARPVPVPGIANVAAVSAGGQHTCVLFSSGHAACWGLNASGQLGNGTYTSSTTPSLVLGWANGSPQGYFVSLAAGGEHSCGVLSWGVVRCWGSNGNGQIGYGVAGGNPTTPAPVYDIGSRLDLQNGASVTLGWRHSCALLRDGTVRCWGLNADGQLGVGNWTQQVFAAPVSGLSGVTSIAAGQRHTCALRTDGSARCWGDNLHGQLGNGTTVDSNVPVNVLALPFNPLSLSPGATHTCAALADGSARCWGSGASGERGDGTTSAAPAPTPVLGMTAARKAAAGTSFSCAVPADGTVWCWGSNVRGQLGDGTTSPSLVPVQVLFGP